MPLAKPANTFMKTDGRGAAGTATSDGGTEGGVVSGGWTVGVGGAEGLGVGANAVGVG